MPTKGTTTLSVRVKDETILLINKSMKRTGRTLNQWLNWAIQERLRKHQRKEA